MKIASWNICADNKFQIENIIYLVSTHNPDIVCLQEITLETIKKIKSQKYFENFDISYCLDFEKNILKKGSSNQQSFYYLVILSKHKLQNKFSDIFNNNPLKMSLASKHFGIHKPRHFQFIDLIYTNNNGEKLPLRVFNLHLEVAGGSTRRIQEFKQAIEKHDQNSINVYCGDLNIFTKIWLNILVGWGFRFSLKEYFINERRSFNRIFNSYKLANHFKKTKTFPKFRLQLDHILTPSFIHIKSKVVSRNTLDSDHKYILLELDLNDVNKDKILKENVTIKTKKRLLKLPKINLSLKIKK